MSFIRITCPGCGTEYQLRPEMAGRKVRCKNCQQVMAIAALNEADLEVVPDDEDTDEYSPRRRPDSDGQAVKRVLLIGGVGALVVLLGAIGLVLLLVKNIRPGAMPNFAAPPDQLPLAAVTPPAPPKPPATWPPLGQAQAIDPGIVMHEVFLRPGDESSKIWVYLPEKADEKLPCVLIAPAGSPLFVGMNLGDGDRAEHLPYVRAGFAVVAYAISGHCEVDKATNAQIVAAASAFKSAGAGVVNARQALDFALAQVPQIDAQKIYAAGHSSAGTLALILAVKEPRIAACVAYAPCVNVVHRLAPIFGRFSVSIPGFMRFISENSPQTQAQKLKCPLFLFHARDDDNVPVRDSEFFVNVVKAFNQRVTLVIAASGGHYDSMIKQGIPQGIKWLKRLPNSKL